MTPEQAASVKVGDVVRLRERVGDVVQCTARWFMVRWRDDDSPEIVRRDRAILTVRMQLGVDSV